MLIRKISEWENACALLYLRVGFVNQAKGNEAIANLCFDAGWTEFEHCNKWRKAIGLKPKNKRWFEREAIDGIEELRAGDRPIPKWDNNPDGISQRRVWGRWFFKGRARDLPIEQLLAATIPGEWGVAIAYRILALFLDKEKAAIAKEIAQEESEHRQEILDNLIYLVGQRPAKRLIRNWSLRLAIAVFLMSIESFLYLLWECLSLGLFADRRSTSGY